MPKIDVAPDHRLLLDLLRHPSHLRALSPSQFSRAIDAAGHARLLGWLLAQSDAQSAPLDPPEWLKDRLISARAAVAEYDRALHWEIGRLRRALGDAGVPWVLLKGAAYLAAALPPGRGRRVADIDVLVPRERLADAEQALLAHAWGFGELSAYDARYYREWMHELPPMIHAERRSVVDVHHAILPRTSRLQPSSARLMDLSVLVEGHVRVLCPTHMVLHAAAHLFHDGEIAGAIRDLVDVDSLLRHFGHNPTFWRDFVREAAELDLRRPAYYAVRYAHQVIGTPFLGELTVETAGWAPAAPVRLLMDSLVRRTVTGPSGRRSPAAFALYVRSHWLRMPPLLLIRHLVRKRASRF
jgi:hypothetical protein